MIKETRGNIEDEMLREAEKSSEDKGTWMKRKPEKRGRIEDKEKRDDTEKRKGIIKLVWQKRKKGG